MRLIEKFKKATRAGIRKAKSAGTSIGAAGALIIGGIGGGAIIESQSPEFQKALKDGASVTQTANTAFKSYLPGADDQAPLDLMHAAGTNDRGTVHSILSYHSDDLDYDDLGKAYIDAAVQGNVAIMQLLERNGDISSEHRTLALVQSANAGTVTPVMFRLAWDNSWSFSAHTWDRLSQAETGMVIDALDTNRLQNYPTYIAAIKTAVQHDADFIPQNHLSQALNALLDKGHYDHAELLLKHRHKDFRSGDLATQAISQAYTNDKRALHMLIEHAGGDIAPEKILEYAVKNQDHETIAKVLEHAGSSIPAQHLNLALLVMAANEDTQSLKALFDSSRSYHISYTSLNIARTNAENAGKDETAKLIAEKIDKKRSEPQPLWYLFPPLIW